MCESPEWIGRAVQARMNAPARSRARPMRAKHITPHHVAAQGETSVQRFALASALLLGATACAFAQAVPPGYPADYQAIIAAAEQEGSVVVYSTTDSASFGSPTASCGSRSGCG